MNKKQRTIAPSQEMTTNLSEASIWDWDVFLSFRGADTRDKFTDHLYNNLKKKRNDIRVFRDAEGLRIGDEISPSLVKAIEGSRISVVIFSKDYASSNACLDELVTILKCKEERKQRVIPIFYEVDPSKLRYQGMDVHENKYGKNSEKVQNWRSAMEIATRLKGESYLRGSEYEFMEKNIKQIMSFLGPPQLYVAEYPVGLGSRISEFISLLESVCSNHNDVHMLGIYGISGIGKTTFAKAVYNMVAVQFESACFLELSTIDGLVRMQERMLATVLGEVDIKLRNIHGKEEMQQRLQNKKILLILDGVDKLEQLKNLAGDCNWFGPGSRVIITTSHQDLLRQHGVNNERTYELKPLDHLEALELFCWHAFKTNEPVADYADISNDLTDYAQGLPLALEIIGADVYGKDKDEWESTLDDHKSIISCDIFTRLKVSYNKLRPKVKHMFLDMACFFNGESWDYLEKIFEGCNFIPKVGMRELKEKCFIRRQDGKVRMHNLVRDMGREIVRQESEGKPGERSRLWHHEDVRQVLTNELGTSTIQGLMLELPECSDVDWDNNCFEKMSNLRILIVRNARFSTPPKQLPNSLIVLNWEAYPSSSFPSDFMGNKLLDLSLGNAIHPIQLGYPFKEFENLKYMRFTGSEQVKKVPNLSWAVNLIEIRLDFCRNLVEFDHDNGMILLPRLQVFSAMGCSNLRAFPEISSKFLLMYNLSGCRRLKSVPPVRSEVLQEICVQGCGENIARCFYGNEVKNYPVVFVPGDTLPWFFQYVEGGYSLSFRVRRRVPTICVGFVLKPMSFSVKLSYEITLSLGDGLLVSRRGDFIQNSCRVFFCFITNGLTEETRTLQDDWVEAKVNGILRFSNTTEMYPANSPISECGAFVNSTDSHFEDVEFYTSRRQCDWALSYVDAFSAVNIKTTTDKGTSFFEFHYVDGDSDDDFDVYGPLPLREKATARVDLPIMGWVKLRAAGYGEDSGFIAARDWTGRWLVGCSSRESRMEYGFTKASETILAKKILAVLLPRALVRESIFQREMISRLRRRIITEVLPKKASKMLTEAELGRLGVIIKMIHLEMSSRLLRIELNFIHGHRDVLEKMSPFKMEHGLSDVIAKSMLQIESVRMATMGPIEMEHVLREIKKSVLEMEHGHKDDVEKLMLEIKSMMQVQMEHKLRDFIEKWEAQLMRLIKMEDVFRDVIIHSVREIDLMSQNKMEHELWNALKKSVLEIESTSQMEMEHGFRDTVECVKPDMEFLKQMTLVLHTELTDIKQGLEWALGRGLLKVIVESDSEDTIRSLVDGVGSDHPCSSLVKECRQLLRKAEEVRLHHVPLKPKQVVEYFTWLPDQRGELGKILRDVCGVE